MVASAWLDARIADIIVSLSFFMLGVVGYLAVFVNIPGAFRAKGDERLLEIAYAVARLGMVLMIGLVTQAVFQAGAVKAELKSVLYVVGVCMVTLGYLGVAVEGKRVRKKES
jgi:hypothetical protein